VKVRDLPPGDLLSVQPETSIADVAGQMRTGDSDAAVVMSEGRLVGIITERDLVRAIADGIDPRSARADLVMTADPATVDADEDVEVVAVKMASAGREQGWKARRPGLSSQPGRDPGSQRRLEARPKSRRRIFGAHAVHLRVQRLRCSLTHARCARSAARRFTRIWATWIAESLAEGFRPRL